MGRFRISQENRTRYKGFTLIEVVIALSLFSLLELCFYPSYKVLQNHAKILKLNNACNYLMLELSAMRTRAFYINDKRIQILKIYSDGKGYQVNMEQGKNKTVMLEDFDWGCINLFCSTSIQFLPGGAPKSYAKIIMQLTDDPEIKKIVEVQPITGRIVVKDG